MLNIIKRIIMIKATKKRKFRVLPQDLPGMQLCEWFIVSYISSYQPSPAVSRRRFNSAVKKVEKFTHFSSINSPSLERNWFLTQKMKKLNNLKKLRDVSEQKHWEDCKHEINQKQYHKRIPHKRQRIHRRQEQFLQSRVRFDQSE